MDWLYGCLKKRDYLPNDWRLNSWESHYLLKGMQGWPIQN
jgi:hypothetical protein